LTANTAATSYLLTLGGSGTTTFSECIISINTGSAAGNIISTVGTGTITFANSTITTINTTNQNLFNVNTTTATFSNCFMSLNSLSATDTTLNIYHCQITINNNTANNTIILNTTTNLNIYNTSMLAPSISMGTSGASTNTLMYNNTFNAGALPTATNGFIIITGNVIGANNVFTDALNPLLNNRAFFTSSGAISFNSLSSTYQIYGTYTTATPFNFGTTTSYSITNNFISQKSTFYFGALNQPLINSVACMFDIFGIVNVSGSNFTINGTAGFNIINVRASAIFYANNTIFDCSTMTNAYFLSNLTNYGSGTTPYTSKIYMSNCLVDLSNIVTGGTKPTQGIITITGGTNYNSTFIATGTTFSNIYNTATSYYLIVITGTGALANLINTNFRTNATNQYAGYNTVYTGSTGGIADVSPITFRIAVPANATTTYTYPVVTNDIAYSVILTWVSNSAGTQTAAPFVTAIANNSVTFTTVKALDTGTTASYNLTIIRSQSSIS
jgi:hypothetical protein